MIRPGKIISAVTNDLTGDQRVHKTALSLLKAGFEPVLVGRMKKGSIELVRTYPVIRFRLPVSKGPLFYACYNIRLFFFLLGSRADLFLANDLDTLPAVWLAARLRGIPYVFDSHEYFTEVPELIHRPLVQQVWKRIERTLVPRTKYMITVNQQIADLFANEYAVHPTVIMNLPMDSQATPSDLGSFDLPKVCENQRIILYQGAVNVGRGLEQMIRAMTLLNGYCLLIVGDGDIKGGLEELVNELSLTDRVCFTGQLPPEVLTTITPKAFVGISLEQDMGLNYRLASPNKIFDYMYAGIPVMVSALPVMSELVRKEKLGRIVGDFSPEGLSNTIREMAADQEAYQIFAKNARIAAARYTWKSQEPLLIDFFNRALTKA